MNTKRFPFQGLQAHFERTKIGQQLVINENVFPLTEELQFSLDGTHLVVETLGEKSNTYVKFESAIISNAVEQSEQVLIEFQQVSIVPGKLSNEGSMDIMVQDTCVMIIGTDDLRTIAPPAGKRGDRNRMAQFFQLSAGLKVTLCFENEFFRIRVRADKG